MCAVRERERVERERIREWRESVCVSERIERERVKETGPTPVSSAAAARAGGASPQSTTTCVVCPQLDQPHSHFV